MKTAIVLPERNDGYKDMDRMIYTLRCHLVNFDEVWIIDWNTPKKSQSLLDKLRDGLPETGKIHNVIITDEMHNEFCKDFDEIPTTIPDHLARNIPLRRSNADWIVQSNIDMFGPHPALFWPMISGLKEDTFYTVSRRELDSTELFKRGIDNWEDSLKHFSENSEERHWLAGCTPNDWFSIINCCGDFQIAHKDLWNLVGGFEEKMVHRNFGDSNIQKKAVLNRKKIEALFSPAIFHISHDYGHLHVDTCKNNDPMYWVERFGKSENTDTWGFVNVEFEIERY